MRVVLCLLVALFCGCGPHQARRAPDPTTLSASVLADTCTAYTLHADGSKWCRADGCYPWERLEKVMGTFEQTEALRQSIESNRLLVSLAFGLAGGLVYIAVDPSGENSLLLGATAGVASLLGEATTAQARQNASTSAVETYNRLLRIEYGLEEPEQDRPRRRDEEPKPKARRSGIFE